MVRFADPDAFSEASFTPVGFSEVSLKLPKIWWARRDFNPYSRAIAGLGGPLPQTSVLSPGCEIGEEWEIVRRHARKTLNEIRESAASVPYLSPVTFSAHDL